MEPENPSWKRPTRIIEWFDLEVTFKGDLAQFPCSEQGHPQFHQVLRILSSLTSNVSRDGESTTSLGNRNVSPCPITTDLAKEFVLFFLSPLYKLKGC